MLEKIITIIANLFKIRSIVTLALTFGMLMLISGKWNPPEQIIALYSTTYGSIMTYFFVKQHEEDKEKSVG